MGKSAARGLVGSYSLDFMLGEYWLVVNREVTLGNIVDQKLPVFLREFGQHGSTNGARGVTAESGVQHVWSYLNSGDSSYLANCQIHVFTGKRVTLCVADQYLRQGPDLHRLAVEAGSLHPGIFLLTIPPGELRLGFPFPGMKRLAALIVSVRHIFADRLAKLLVGRRLEWASPGDITVHDVTAGKLVRLTFAVQ